jgi:hypothetical protein
MRTINYVRPRGARILGQITWPAGIEFMGIVVSVEGVAAKSPFDDREWTPTLASLTAGKDGGFLTERIAPGSYVLKAEAYAPLTPEQRAGGFPSPSYRALATIDVPHSGELVVPELNLEPTQ